MNPSTSSPFLEKNLEEYTDSELSNDEEREKIEDKVEEEVFYPLPPLPPPSVTPKLYGIETSEIYKYIVELRRRVDGVSEREQSAAVLQEMPDVLLGVAQVMHESQLLRRRVEGEEGEFTEEVIPLPEMKERIMLPPGYSSWIVND